MVRKILIGTLIGLSALFLLASVAGIIAAWAYNEPLTRDWTSRLTEVEATMAQVQDDLQIAKTEVERALRILDSAETALASLTQQTADAASIIDDVSNALDDQILPGLKSTRDNIADVRAALEDLRANIEELNSIPLLNLNVPGTDLLDGILGGLDSLDSEVGNVEELATRVSTFVSDSSYLLGGDFSETRTNLETLLATLQDYDAQITGWRAQVTDIKMSLPGWIDRASIYITLFLLWFGFSQFGLFLHGLNLGRGENPLEALRVFRRPVKEDGNEPAGSGSA